MKQLTVRNFEPDLLQALQEAAKIQGLSLNQAALLLMRRGAGLGEKLKRPRIGNALDRFVGSMSEQEERDFIAATDNLSQVDVDFWQ